MTRKRDKHQGDKDELKRTFETLWRQLDGPELEQEYKAIPGLDKSTELCYTGRCLGERNRGVLLLNAVDQHNTHCGQSAPYQVDSRPAVRLDNDGKPGKGCFVMSHLCQNCGVEVLNDKQKFCSKKCRSTYYGQRQIKSRPVVTCLICGKQFTANPSEVARGQYKYCSNACKGLAMSKQYQEKATILQCSYCGKDFRISASELGRARYCSTACFRAAHHPKDKYCKNCGQLIVITRGFARKKFCSPSCYWEWNHGENCACYKGKVEQTCETCGAKFEVVPAVVGYGQGRFCSRRCYAMWKSKEPAYSRARGGKRDDLNGMYVRSGWEANYARYLNWLKALGEITNWQYEVDTFEFVGIKRGVRFYTPDFKIFNPDGSIEYHEVKGWMDKKSQTKLSRMGRYHPGVKLVLIEADSYYDIEKKVGKMIPHWEWKL